MHPDVSPDDIAIHINSLASTLHKMMLPSSFLPKLDAELFLLWPVSSDILILVNLKRLFKQLDLFNKIIATIMLKMNIWKPFSELYIGFSMQPLIGTPVM